jgi:hypothetical protein
MYERDRKLTAALDRKSGKKSAGFAVPEQEAFVCKTKIKDGKGHKYGNCRCGLYPQFSCSHKNQFRPISL